MVDLQFVLVLGVQKSDLVICTYASFFFQILFPYRLLQTIEYSSLRYIAEPCWQSILYAVMYIC